jgi:AraC family L-rhamnose operon regulatory protein RhaS
MDRITPCQFHTLEGAKQSAQVGHDAPAYEPGRVSFAGTGGHLLNLIRGNGSAATSSDLLTDHRSRQSVNRADHRAPNGAAANLSGRPKAVGMPDFGVVVFESQHAPGFADSVDRQDFSEFLLVISGHVRLDSGDRMFHLGANSLLHSPAQSELRYQDMPRQPVRLCSIQYRDEILPTKLTRQLADLGVLHWNFRTTASPLLQALQRACKEMLYEQYCQQPGWETVLVSRMFDLVVDTLRFASRRAPALCQPSFEKNSDSVMRVMQYAKRLESEFSHLTTLDEAASSTGLSRRRFTALFRSVTGQSWHQRLLDLRLAHARFLLSQTDRTIVAVAFDSGFGDLSHFNHVFRQAFGCSPSAIRRKPKQ